MTGQYSSDVSIPTMRLSYIGECGNNGWKESITRLRGMSIDPSANPPAQPFRLFISYAHKGEVRKDRLLTALTPYKRIGLIETWDGSRD
jgi:hypothetical protein